MAQSRWMAGASIYQRVTFSTLEESAQGIASIQSDYDRHSRAAREIAAEYFDSRKVLADLVEQAFAQPAGKAP